MPVYTYRCENCGVQFERHQSFTDTPLKTCPECRKKTLRKVIGPTRIIFKGSGFYVTDNKSASSSTSASSKKKKNETKAVGEGTAAGESKPVKKEESKPAAPSSSDSSE